MSASKDAATNIKLGPRIRARLLIVEEQNAKRVNSILTRMGKERQQSLARTAERIAQADEPQWIRLRALYTLLDKYMEFITPDIACRRGCNHCCHGGVSVARTEAEMIGRKLGIRPKKVPARDPKVNDISWGYHNPCTFLRDGECSIYEDRPLACREHTHIDIDSTLCELDPPNTWPVGRFKITVLLVAYLKICGTHTADIRDFFPPDTAKVATQSEARGNQP